MVLLIAALLPARAHAQGTPPARDAFLYIIWPEDGATLKSPFWCRFGLRNMGITHAGDDFPNSGHHHLLVDVDEPIDPNEPIPEDRKHLHFGAGETEALVDLPPGKHTLQLVFGDGKHFPFNPPLESKKISITIRAEHGRERSAERGREKRVEARRARVPNDPAPPPADAAGALPAAPSEECTFSGPLGIFRRCPNPSAK